MKTSIKAPVSKRQASKSVRKNRSDEDFKIKTIVVAVNLEAASRRAVSAGKALALQTGAQLVLLHVVDELHNLKDFGYGTVDWPRSNDEGVKEGRKKLEWLRCRTGEGCLLCTADVRSGDPATEIARAATALNADLIIMATHHLTVMLPEGVHSPSVAEAVLRISQCPVLLFPISRPAAPRKK